MNKMICKFCNNEMYQSDCYVYVCRNHPNVLVIFDNISNINTFWSVAKDGVEIGNANGKLIVFTHKIPDENDDDIYEDMLLNGFHYGSYGNNKGDKFDIDFNVSPDNFDEILPRIKKLIPFL